MRLEKELLNYVEIYHELNYLQEKEQTVGMYGERKFFSHKHKKEVTALPPQINLWVSEPNDFMKFLYAINDKYKRFVGFMFARNTVEARYKSERRGLELHFGIRGKAYPIKLSRKIS